MYHNFPFAWVTWITRCVRRKEDCGYTWRYPKRDSMDPCQ